VREMTRDALGSLYEVHPVARYVVAPPRAEPYASGSRTSRNPNFLKSRSRV